MNNRSSYLSPEKFVCSQEVMVRTLYGTTDLLKTEKEVQCNQAAYCQLAYLTSIQSTSCKMLGWMNHKLESRLFGEIKIKQKKKKHRNLRYANNIALMAESGEEVKSLLMRVKEEREKAGLKLNIQ